MSEEVWFVAYRESDRLIAEAFDLDAVPAQWTARLGEFVVLPDQGIRFEIATDARRP